MRRMQKPAPLHVAVGNERRLAAIVAVLLVPVCSDFFNVVFGRGFPEGKVKFLLTVAMAFIALTRLRFLLRAAVAAPELALLLLMALLSAFWSLDPMLTVERTFQLYCTSALAMLLASMLSMRSLVLTLASIAAVFMISSIIAIGLVPSARGAPPWPNTWRGIFGHKNGLGAISAIALILMSAAISISSGPVRAVFVALAALSFVLLVASESRTSQVIAVFCVFSIALAAISRNHIRAWMILFLGIFLLTFVVVLVVILTGLADSWLEAIGRRATLSNRIPLWKVVWPEITKSIWTGYGYETYWDPDAERVARIQRIPLLGFTPHYSHNGLLELLLNVGIVGVPLTLMALGRAVLGASVALRVKGIRLAAASALVMLVAFVLFNVTESLLMNSDSFGWVVVVALLTKLSLLLQLRSRRWMLTPAATAARGPRLAARRHSFPRAQ